MIPIVREFFRGLKERDELDVIIPELLTAMGFEVLSRPMTGTKQYGSDVAATGVDDDGVRKLFLFVIKRGDLTRDEWDTGPQSVRQSLNEVRDAYLSGLTSKHRKLPVVLCPTIGGVVRENVLRQVNGYIDAETRPGFEVRLWTGDTLTGKIVEGALREEVFPPAQRTMLRRAAALVEEPGASFAHFAQLVDQVCSYEKVDALSRVRILYLALWILAVWGREANNLEAPYRAAELVTMRSWDLLWAVIAKERSEKLPAGHAFFEVVQLYLGIWEELYAKKVLPHSGSRHALSYAAWSHEAVDVNLALFETLGRVAMGGLWHAWLATNANTPPSVLPRAHDMVDAIAVAVAAMIETNRVLYTPQCDDQAIDISLALILLTMVKRTRGQAAHYVSQISNATKLCHVIRHRYPVVERDYATLIHLEPGIDEERRKELTAGSILYPVLASFARAFGNTEIVQSLGDLQTRHLDHCNMQIWVPNANTEQKIWRGERNGSALGGLKIGEDGAELLASLRKEMDQNTAYASLSAIKLDHWPVLLLACQTFRVPPPPQIWMSILDGVDLNEVEWVSEFRPRRVGGAKKVRTGARRSTSSQTPLVTFEAEIWKLSWKLQLRGAIDPD